MQNSYPHHVYIYVFLPWLLFPLWRKAPRDIQPENIVISGLKDTNRAKRVPDTRPLTDLFPLPDLTQFNFQNHRVLGKPKHHVYPKYPNYPEIPGIPGSTQHTQKYLRVNKVHCNTRSNISTLLPDLNPDDGIYCNDHLKKCNQCWHQVQKIREALTQTFDWKLSQKCPACKCVGRVNGGDDQELH